MADELNKTIKILPDEEDGYEIKDVLVDDESIGIVEEYTFENINQDHTLHAIFGLKSYTISPSAGINGKIYPTNDVLVEHGSNKTFFMEPDDYYGVNDVIVDGVSQGAIEEYTFENVTEPHEITVSFIKNWLEGYDYRYNLIINKNEIPENDTEINEFPVYLDLSTLSLSGSGPVTREWTQEHFETGTLDYVRSKSEGLKLVDFEDIVTTLSPENRTQTSVKLNGNLVSMQGFPELDVSFQWYEYGLEETIYETPIETKTSTGNYSYVLEGIESAQQYSYRAVVADDIGHIWLGRWENVYPYVYEEMQTSTTEILSGDVRLAIKTSDPEIDKMQTSTTEILSGDMRLAGTDYNVEEIDKIQTSTTEILSGTKI